MNTNWKHLMTRRAFLTGILAIPAMAMAHDGHGASRISAEANVLSVQDGVVKLQLDMMNLGSNPIALIGIGAESAGAVVLATPVEIKAFGVTGLEVELQFRGPVPGVFTAYLDFGEHGRGPVLVMP